MFKKFHLCTLLVFLLLAVSLTAQTSSQTLDLSPSEMHQILWEQKSQSLLNKQIIRQLSASTEANTQTNYDVQFYDVFIRVNDTTEILYGAVRFVGEIVDPNVTELQVDLFSTMNVDSIIDNTYGALAYTELGDVVTITLDHAYASGEQFDFTFYYNGHPTEGGFQAFSFELRNGAKVISSLSEPYFSRTWWPCKDRNDDKADSFYIAFQVDTSLYAASNGTLDSTNLNGDNTHTFFYSVRYPMVTYLFSVAISNYTVWTDEWIYNSGADTLPLLHAVFPDMYVYSLSHYNVTPEVLTHLSKNFGPYPYPDEKYGHANFTWGGGMEHQTITSMSGSTFGFYEPVVVHEAGHQWWGDMITCNNWSDIWLNEGWASYSEALFYYERGGWDDYHSYMAGMDYSGGGSIYIYDTTNVNSIFGSIVYDKGAWACHMLRGILGDSAFFEGIDAYYNSQYKFASATTEDFKNVFEASSGQELDYFFEDWIFGTYRPNYRYSYYSEPTDSTGYDLYIKVQQLQNTNPTVFRMPIDFAVNRAGVLTADTITLFNDQRLQLFKVVIPSVVNSVELDPSDWILKYSTLANWSFTILTTQDEISSANQYVAYADTIYGVGSQNISAVVYQGALPAGIVLSTNGILSGSTTDTGSFNFSVYMQNTDNGTYDTEDYVLYVSPLPYVPGDVDENDIIDIADIVGIVDFMFSGGEPPANPNAADVNNDCLLDISDLVAFVAFSYSGGSPLLPGCIN